MTTFAWLLPYLNTGLLTFIAGGVFTLVWRAASLTEKVNLIMTNHLPHLQAAIDLLRADFTRHLDRGDD